MRFPAPYRPAGAVSRPGTSGRDVTAGDRSRSGPRQGGQPDARLIDRYRGAGSDRRVGGRSAGHPSDRARGGASDRARGGASDRAPGAGDVRYDRGPVDRLKAPPRSRAAGGKTGDGVSGPKGRDGGRGPGPKGSSLRGRGVGEHLNRLDEARRANPKRADDAVLTGDVIGRAQDTALRASIGAVGGLYAAPYRGIQRPTGTTYGVPYGTPYYSPYYCPWGFTYYGSRFSFSFGFGYSSPCYSYWWPTYVSCWYPLWYWGYRPYYYSSAYPVYYSTVVYDTVNADESYAEEEVVEEEPAARPSRSALSVAAERYLTLGDRAFREGRYTHAVQFYAKAVELAPDEGALFLVLGDALFAAGDYHYGAYSIRRALELDPTLVDAAVDKHEFYLDPADFDRQLAVLERYIEDHPSDRDARLVLAINDLMGGRPAAAVDLLESPQSASLVGDPAADLVLDAARRLQFGPPAED